MKMFQLFLLVVCFISSTVISAPSPDLSSPIISSQLKSAFKIKDVVNIFITLRADTNTVLTSTASSTFHTRSDKLNALYSALFEHSQKTQRQILGFLSTHSHLSQSVVKSFWITNQIFITDADAFLVSDLLAQFSEQILLIDEEFYAHLIQPVSIRTNITLTSEMQWGVEKIQAPKAWEEMGEVANDDEKVVVATIDTGVRGTHEALRNNFVGDYGWLDPSNATSFPTDNVGHGTHTTGTIAGSKGIGVSPNVRWAACRGCAGFLCAQSHLLACGEFFTCPTLSDGSKRDCSRAPLVISNSWGGGRGSTWYNAVIEAWHVGGIIPVFSIGNAGPMCYTPNSPGDQNVIGVGSTMSNDARSLFSSAGPTLDGVMKPDISAPGSDIISAYHTADDDYASLSGTSMSTPHVAGTIALLKARNKLLTYQEVKSLLFPNTDRNLMFTGRTCDGIRDNVFPNHIFGNGRVNAFKSVQAQTRVLQSNKET